MNTLLENALSEAVLALYVQGKKSVSGAEFALEFCRYRGDEEACCLIGHMINYDHYSLELEGSQASDEIVTTALEGSIGHVLTGKEVIALDHLQASLHDDLSGENFRYSLLLALKEEKDSPFASKALQFIETYNKENNS
ncbi:MAG: hypothetical protein HRU12_19545 [Phaeodactylibacter sp.]|nr:hypothetical protein [Phaeodactylibacter sp.]